jgi:hypothetical protein
MKKPVKGHLSLFATIILVVGTCLVTGGFLIIVNGKTGWQDAPTYSGALNVQSQVSSDGSVKTTTFTAHEYYTRLVDIYLLELNFRNWFVINLQSTPVLKATLDYIDNSKNIEIPDLLTVYQNNCPAYFLDVTFENVTRSDSRITLVQTAGPCGKPLS